MIFQIIAVEIILFLRICDCILPPKTVWKRSALSSIKYPSGSQLKMVEIENASIFISATGIAMIALVYHQMKSFNWSEDKQPVSPRTIVLSHVLSGLKELNVNNDGYIRNNQVEYRYYRQLLPNWVEVSNESIDKSLQSILQEQYPFKSIYVSKLFRAIESLDDVYSDGKLGTFRVYKMKLKDECFARLNSELVEDSLRQQLIDKNNGMKVSNAGGYHSITDYFNTTCNEEGEILTQSSSNIRSQLAAIAFLAVSMAEADDFASSRRANAADKNLIDPQNRLRRLQSAAESEAWININRHGHWNRLHTHEGAAWSGIYYLQCPPIESAAVLEGGGEEEEACARSCGGRLLIKPSPHISEVRNYDLTKLELARLNSIALNADDSRHFSSCCDYLEIEPEEGMLIIMPGWLQHAVLPLQIRPEFRASNTGTRISIAFNFVENV